MRHSDDSMIFEFCPNQIAHQVVSVDIGAACCFIQDQDLALGSAERTTKTEQLLLSLRERLFVHFRIQTASFLESVPELDLLHSCDDSFVCDRLRWVGIDSHASTQYKPILGNNYELGADDVARNKTKITPIDPDRPAVKVDNPKKSG